VPSSSVAQVAYVARGIKYVVDVDGSTGNIGAWLTLFSIQLLPSARRSGGEILFLIYNNSQFHQRNSIFEVTPHSPAVSAGKRML
jgi:hypothetical protein